MEQKLKEISEPAIYACSYCGNTEHLMPAKHHICEICKKKEWVKALNSVRVK
ncbi:MAG: hypothetical protein V4677_16140 [Bacteroidota bacterium]